MEEKPQNEKTLQLKYFIDNKIVDSNSSKSISENYLSIPFKIFSLLFKSFTEDSVKITNNLSLSKNIWDEKYFKNTNINNISRKKDIFILYIFRMEVFLLQYKKKRKITRELIENLCQEMNQNFFIKVMSSNNINFIFQNFVGEIKKDFENLQKKSYMEIIKYLIQNAIRINEILKSSNLNNYDYIEDDKEREEVLNVQNNRLILAQFFSNTILNIILSDLQYALISYIKDKNQK
jgi:hypothetical protein